MWFEANWSGGSRRWGTPWRWSFPDWPKSIIRAKEWNVLGATQNWTFLINSLAHGGRVNCLKEISKILTRLLLELFPNEMTLSDIFGTSCMSGLRSLIVSSSVNNVDLAFRPLSSANFSKLSAIKHLTINQIAISSIQPGTFDFIGETLISLNLINSRLKQIDVGLFFRSHRHVNRQSDDL